MLGMNTFSGVCTFTGYPCMFDTLTRSFVATFAQPHKSFLYFTVSGKLNQVHFVYLKHLSSAFSAAFAFNSVGCGFSHNHTAGNVDPLS